MRARGPNRKSRLYSSLWNPSIVDACGDRGALLADPRFDCNDLSHRNISRPASRLCVVKASLSKGGGEGWHERPCSSAVSSLRRGL